MQQFINDVGNVGLRIEWNVLADCQRVVPQVNDQRAFVHQVVERCRGWTNCFVSLGNEWPQNGWRPENFERPAGANPPLFSFGSALSDTAPGGRGDYLEWHAGTRSESLGPVQRVCAEAFFGEFRDR